MPDDTPATSVTADDQQQGDRREPLWLDAAEQRAWRQLAAVILKLPSELEARLQRDAGMSHFEYWVIALLSETPDRTLRMSQLAARANASLSRLSHVMSRLEKRGWATRRPCPDDARATLAVLTDTGWDEVVAAAPGHVATVRQLVFDGLDPEDVDELARVCGAILERLDGA
ncbi:MarR family winged helix-turn-helix transcriptional regulator [Egicoccus halophilus]|uniref:MarR family transcriptional regulator n=1 Tax=Egicoccus halophilus TaxID=1670830 RepID=A0A8J3ESL4_9ACTN|nr:MarR family transcriptional regulator [Egicoccus halophilus]GGI03657.1 MarR family transcriptional regulator [Egicoccus halophilus]